MQSLAVQAVGPASSVQAKFDVSSASPVRCGKALRAAALALVVILGWGPAPAAQAHTEETAEAALWARLRGLESAFRQGDATALRLASPSSGKVRVDLPPWTDGPTSYGPGQVQGVFAQVFADRRTHTFSFPREDVSLSREGTAFARGRWVWVPPAGDRQSSETLVFSLRSEGGDWRVQEIRRGR
jgi:hypothetical protein